MQVGDLVQATIAGLGIPTRIAIGILIRPMASIYWRVLLEDGTLDCFEEYELKVINESR